MLPLENENSEFIIYSATGQNVQRIIRNNQLLRNFYPQLHKVD